MRWCRGCMPTRGFPAKGEIQQRAMQPAFVAWLGCPTAGPPSIATNGSDPAPSSDACAAAAKARGGVAALSFRVWIRVWIDQ